MITLENINKIYKVDKDDFYALRGVNLEISGGEFVSVCGASGSGKTTLLNIIGCLDDPSSGTYRLKADSELFADGIPVDITKLSGSAKAKIRNKDIGFVLQDFALINTQSVLYNVELPLLFSKMPYSSIKRRALEVLELVGIKEQAGKRANQLSGGQRQRVAIARALVNDPSIILADEPTGQLDSRTGMQIMHILSDINSQGKTVIVVTHDKDVASIAHRTVIMSDGIIR